MEFKERKNKKSMEFKERKNKKNLGFNISLTKCHIIKDAELSIKKNFAIIRNKLLVNLPQVQNMLHNSYIVSNLLYFLGPLYHSKFIDEVYI
jgi:hypothetical protein